MIGLFPPEQEVRAVAFFGCCLQPVGNALRFEQRFNMLAQRTSAAAG